MVKILREANSSMVPEVATKYGVSDQTLYLWWKKFGAMGVNDTKRLKQLEHENALLRKLLADRDIKASPEATAQESVESVVETEGA